MKACIISIGEELLIGQTINTNAAWMAARLNELGIETHEIVVITDRHEEILRSLRSCGERVDLLLITGGLGPTRDDVTKHTLCEYFSTELVFDEQVWDDVKTRLTNLGREVTDFNREQALVPRKAKALRNPFGTAPGLWFSEDGKIYVAMPGVPHEMREMMQSHVLPALEKLPREQHIIHKNVLTQGIGESALAEKLSHWEDQLPPFIQLAYLPSMSRVKLRLTAKGENKEFLNNAIEKEVEKIRAIVPEHIWGYDNDTMESIIGELLKKHGLTLATAESCTGGYIAHVITSIPGASAYYKGSIIAYDNEIKQRILGINPADLEKYGAVSEEVARQMATGLKKLFDVDYAIGITGIAGPDGGTPEKPVGTTWIAVAGKTGCESKLFRIADNRERHIVRATRSAMGMLINKIKKD